MKKKREKRSQADRIAMLSILALSANQLAFPITAAADELTFEGTTQMPTEDYSLDVDTFAVELTVEEVYAEAGSSLAAGDKILKLTSESYEDALDYYEAAVLRATNTLTDTQLEYDQGILEAKYEYEAAQTKSSQAEFVKEYQTEELTDTIEEHEETADDLADKISEVETGISEGSYSSSSSSGSSGGSSASAGGSTDTSDDDELTDPESSEEENGTGENTSGENNSGETDVSGGTAVPGSSENGSAESDANNTEETTDQKISSLKEQIETSTQKYNEIWKELANLLGIEISEQETDGESGEESDENTGEESGENTDEESGENTDEESGENTSEETSAEEVDFTDGEAAGSSSGNESTLAAELQTSIDGDTIIKGHMENVQKMVKNVPESVTSAATLAGIEYEQYIKLLDECIQQMQTNLEAQQKVLTALNETDAAEGSGSEDGNTENSGDESSVDTESVCSLLTQMEEVNTERTNLYTQLLEIMTTELTEQQEEISELTNSGETGQETENNGETENNENSVTQTEGNPEGTEENETQENSENSAAASGDTSGFPSGSTNSAATSGTGASASGFSMASGASGGGTASGTSGTASGTTVTVSEASGGSMSMEDLNLTEEDISLFGDTYDLTQIQNLLDQEPADSDSAESLLEQLEEAADTVEDQYEELTRNQKATELKIQYTYDTAVLDGKLAEITYEQTLQEWEDTLQEAEDNKAELEEKKELLESMTDGVITSENGGTVAAVNYEADDVLNSATPILSYYDTSEVTVTISVSQDEIAEMKVGDSVSVSLSGMPGLTGTVSEKSLEATEGTSRTEVDYEVTISIDNESGMLSSGLSAEISFESSGSGAEESTDEAEKEGKSDAAEEDGNE